MRITLEIIEQLTPEQIKALPLEEKREALVILEALEISRLKRILGVQTPAEPPAAQPIAAQPIEQQQLEAKPGPIPTTPQTYNPETDPVMIAARERLEKDFITKLCGQGSTRPN